jgi:hypothetical protein
MHLIAALHVVGMKMNLDRWPTWNPPVSEQHCFECGHNTVKNIPRIQGKSSLTLSKSAFQN